MLVGHLSFWVKIQESGFTVIWGVCTEILKAAKPDQHFDLQNKKPPAKCRSLLTIKNIKGICRMVFFFASRSLHPINGKRLRFPSSGKINS